MNCRKVSNLLSAFIDSELPGVEHRAIHEHLSRCAACAAEHQSLLDMKRMVARLRVQRPPEALPAHIIQQARSSTQQNAALNWSHRLYQPVSSRGLIPVGLALGALMAIAALQQIGPSASVTGTPIRWSRVQPGDVALLSGRSPEVGDALNSGAPSLPQMPAVRIPVSSTASFQTPSAVAYSPGVVWPPRNMPGIGAVLIR